MNIYQAKRSDIPKIVPCSWEYTSMMPNNVKLDPDHLVACWERFFDSGIGVIYLAEENGGVIGGIGGIKYQEIFTGNLTAVEMFWFISEGKRGAGIKLFKLYEQWAIDNGCKRIAMIYLPFSMPEKLERFYTLNGYRLLEMHYEKELQP